MTHRYSNPTAIVIFGGTGNLAETKLFPALFHLFIQKMLPLSFTLVGLSRRDLSHEAYQDFVRSSILAKSPDSDPSALQEFCNRVRFVSGSFSDGQSYIRIKEELLRFDASIGQCTSKLFYLAVPPEYYREIFENIKQSEAMALCDGIGSWARILVEKPFGSDIKTAEHLETQLQESFTEDQVYRIDHYLAKDAIENIISLRFANSILADSWDGSHIESISISLFESQDVSTRGSFYDGIGALRDVGQNHMLQMLALLTMSPADVHDALSVRKSRLAAIRSFVMHDTDVRVRGQYQGYKETVGVHPESDTETYFKVSTHIDSELWKDVAVTLEAGKALHTSLTEAVITFRSTDQCMCAPEPEMHAHRNVLRISFSPEQSIRLTMWVKEPGFDFKLHERELVLATQEGEVFRSPEAYERVLYDCIIGDQTRFVSGEEVVAAWNFITPLLDSLKREPLREYAKGSHAPISIT